MMIPATSSEGSSLLMDQIVCFGDSITQQSWGPGGMGAALADVYQRKRDVVNRGLSGYNTAWALPIIKQWLPRVGESRAKISLILIWFGANDSTLPPSPQSITLEEFKANLHLIMELFTKPDSPYYSPETKFLLLTCPPIDVGVRAHELSQRVPPLAMDRDYERTHQFAVAVKDVAKEVGSPFVDVWTAVVDAAARDGGLGKYLRDGLHLSPEGYGVVINEVASVIARELPDLHWDKLEQVFPHWASIVNDGALGPQFVKATATPVLKQ
ncbi:SGNH hydrolase [Meredithblackwellia eburnea MCA 4105]